MLYRKAATDKLLLLGVDGLDPRYTCKMLEEKKMPNLQKLLDNGACSKDLVMLGGHPTVTPPMWTTLATGCYANVHGITGFWRKGSDIDKLTYNIDSRLCKAEPLWNCFAEAGKKTLVWHWPGASWPPTSDSPNLMVVDGTSPGNVGMAIAQVDGEFLVSADETFQQVSYQPAAAIDAVPSCVIEDLELEEQPEMNAGIEAMSNHTGETAFYVMGLDQTCTQLTEQALDAVFSPIKPASGWKKMPEGAKEFTILLSKGLIRRPCLILKNEEGVYDTVEVYKSKKDENPITILKEGIMNRQVVDEAVKADGTRFPRVNRNMKLLQMKPDGSQLTVFISAGNDMENDSVWHPKSLFKEVGENVGYPTPTSFIGTQNKVFITDCMLDCWNATADWQADSLLYLIKEKDLDVIFSHFHAIDMQEHMFIKHLADRPFNRLPHEDYVKFMDDIYIQTDYYLGKFVHLLDEGWTIAVFSDHGQVAPKHDIPVLAEMSGVSIPVMEELGYTVMKKDENGNDIAEIDWGKTRAVAQREGHIYINLKGRDPHGIVDPADKYELEEQIMTDLYSYKDKETGHRVVSLALRNKDAVLIGQGGPEAGDIYFTLAENYNYDHADCLSTTYGEEHTSVSPIFLIAGKGVKKNFVTDRIIRQIDFVPTIAVLGGVRMPAQCEGAPAYQILEEEY